MKENKITLKDALTYGRDKHTASDIRKVKNNPPTPLELINIYLGTILNKVAISEKLIIFSIALTAINCIISLCIIIFK